MSKRFTRQEKSQPKHSHYSSTQPITRNNVVIPSNPSSRPEWRGAGYHKPKKRVAQKPRADKEDVEIKNCMPEKLQKDFLTVVKTAFPICQREYEDLRPLLTDVRTALDAGGEAFEERTVGEKNREMRKTFLVRWGVERALLLTNLLGGWMDDDLLKEEPVFEDLRKGTSKTLCFGTGTPELSSLAMLLSRELRQRDPATLESLLQPALTDPASEEPNERPATGQLSICGSADWTPETEAFLKGLEAPPVLSKYASAAARAAAAPFLPPNSLEVHHISQTSLETLDFSSLGTHPSLILFSFTLRDMRNTSLAKTIKTLVALSRDAPKDSLLMVVDEEESPEALKGAKRYPLRFVLDLALLGKGTGSGTQEPEEDAGEGDEQRARVGVTWEKLVSHEQRSFKPERCGEYPISLGKIAVQVYLFKKR